ncbi:unnamed protein product [Somion occarium]|uniref:Ubiquitin-like-conjugating enzyme ATG10 n=1 Tax=Somion occarium TaxID=3059160 RepID=A0ABP1D556_9APHY
MNFMSFTTLTHAEFEEGCKAFISKCALDRDPISRRKYPPGWHWHEHTSFPQLGYMSRSLSIPAHSLCEDHLDDETDEVYVEVPEDDAEAPQVIRELVTVTLSVVYSPTYQVPALYFTAHHTSGSPLTLPEITRLPLFREGLFPDEQGGSFALNVPDSSFAMLSQGDHPTLGTPSWYLHPCHTSAVVSEILSVGEWGDHEQAARWIESWFLVLGNVVDFTPHNSSVMV